LQFVANERASGPIPEKKKRERRRSKPSKQIIEEMSCPTLLCLLLLIIICLNDSAAADDFGFLYNGFTGSKLLLDGAASVTQDGILSLTTNSFDITGYGFHPNPLPFTGENGMAVSFSSTFVFTITPNPSGRSGDGMALVISARPDLSSRGFPGAYLGLGGPSYYKQNEQFFAVELDTVFNGEFKDIDDNHVGIDVSSMVSNFSTTAGYSYTEDDDNLISTNFEALRLSSGSPMQVWVDYDGESMELNVTLALVPMNKPSLPLLSYTVNMSDHLPSYYDSDDSVANKLYVGFSAATGYRHGAAHQVLGWSFNLTAPAPPLDYSQLPLKRVQQIQGASKAKNLVRWLPATLSVLAGATACLVLRWRSNKKSAERRQDWEAELGPRRFSYRDLRKATDGFSSRQLLGQGGCGRVYGGVHAGSGKRIAVKRITSEPAQGLAQFTAEILILGRLRHRNLVRLFGYCRQSQKHDELLLVYEHMPNGSLDRYLHGQKHDALAWSQRFHIIKGVASGLLYLHEDWEQVILHRDVKASNVLLDAEMNGRLGDFGLARLHDHGADAHTTHVAGTRGYLAPELLRFGKATKATDVFAFGAFVLEVACGRRPVGLNARGELLVLLDWVRQIWATGCIADAMDPRLLDCEAHEAELVLKLGLLCSHPLPAARPGMRQVMQHLDGGLPLPEFSADYLAITDVDQVLETSPSVATTITGLSGGR